MDIVQQPARNAKYVRGLDGGPMTVANLPAATTTRWTPKRKAEVVIAVEGGLISIAEACERYGLAVEEYLSWQASMAKDGVPGLRATQLQNYRGKDGDGMIG
jgi:hypothetical protein